MSHWSENLIAADHSCGTLTIDTHRLDDEAMVRDHLARSASDGWMCLASEVYEGSPAQLPVGPLLSGDWLLEDGGSGQLRRDGSGWRIDEYHWKDDATGPHRSIPTARGRIGGGQWQYRVVWARDEDEIWRPWAAPLTSIEREETR
jgi:hypothetical protein